MPVNVLLRFSWVLNFVPNIRIELLWFVVAMLEAYRRLQWNFFRMENEVSFSSKKSHFIKRFTIS
jgi:hypothetical protein